MSVENFVEMWQFVEVQAAAFVVGLVVLFFLAVWAAVLRDRRTVRQILAMLDEGREVLDRIKNERESVEWLLARMKDKIEEKNTNERRRAVLNEIDTQMDRIVLDYGGLTMGDAGQRMDDAFRPKRRRMVEVQNTALGDAWIVPAEEEQEAPKRKFREDVQAGLEIPF